MNRTKNELFPFASPFRATVTVPGSKSLTNRLLPLAALSGKSEVCLREVLKSEDTEVMIAALRSFGVHIEVQGGEGSNYSEVKITGADGKFPAGGEKRIDVRNSGTTMRFLAALALLREGITSLRGNERMTERPIEDLVHALNELGESVTYLGKTGYPPLQVAGRGSFLGGQVEISGRISSQFFSALLLLGALSVKGLKIHILGDLVSRPYVEMTVALLRNFGAKITSSENDFTVEPGRVHLPSEIFVEGDATAATYPLGIAMVTGGGATVQNLYSNSLQGDIKFASTVLSKMGAQVRFVEKKGGLFLRAPEKLLPLGEMDLSSMPDAAMTAVVVAAVAEGKSILTGLSTLRQKESDRIEALVSNLRRMGATVSAGTDFIMIEGDRERLHGAEIETYDDHRVAMCFAVLGSIIPGVTILDPECVGKTYPTFWEEYERCGTESEMKEKN